MSNLLKTLIRNRNNNGGNNGVNNGVNNEVNNGGNNGVNNGVNNSEGKYNPDISNLFNNANQIRQTTNYQFSNEGYKTIMNEKITKPIKSQDDLKIEYKKADQKERPEILKKIQELENERLNEKQKLSSQIDHSKKLDELIKIKRKEINIDYEASTHTELKQIQINQNDKIKKEKEKFNNIINSLNDILR